MSEALDNSFAAVATNNDSSNTGGEGGLADLSAVKTVATEVGGVEVLSINSCNDSSDVKESEESEPLFGVEVLNGNPTFSNNNDQMADSPKDNEVSKYSFYSCLTHYMDGHKISESNQAAVEICLLSVAGAFVRNMYPMCVFWLLVPGVVLPLTPRKVLPICVTQ